MSKFCPKCGSSIPENSMFCPICYERFTNPVEDTKSSEPKGLVCPQCRRELKNLNGTHCPHCNYKIYIERPRGIVDRYIEYEKMRAGFSAIICPIVGTGLVIGAIVGAFFHLAFLFLLFVAALFYVIGLLCYFVSKD